MAEIIRRKLQGTPGPSPKRRASKDPILKVAGVCSGANLSYRIDEELYSG
jgi:hypothetical protein